MADNYWSRKQAARVGGLNRRRFLWGAGAISTAFVLACGNDDKNDASGSRSGTTSGGSTGATTGTTAAGGQTGAAKTPAPRGGTMTTAQVATDAQSFHAHKTTDAVSSTYQGWVYDGALTSFDPQTLEPIPNIAEKWTVSDDKKTYTFTLRDVKWSDGTPMTTADYVYNFEQAFNPDNKFPYRSELERIESYKALDARTLQVTMKEALVTGLQQADLLSRILPKHIWEKYDWNDPTKNPEMMAPTVGNGPFKLKEWRSQNLATFVANDTYWKGRPNIDEFNYRFFGTTTLAYQALKSGEIDFYAIQPQDVKDAKAQSSLNVLPYYTVTGGYNFMGFNLRRPWFQDVRVRQAIAYATDRKGIIESVAYGQGRPVYSTFTQSAWVYNDKVEKYDYNPKKSEDLLKQAGYTLGGDKKLRKDGQTLKLSILFNTGNNVREGIATVMQQQLNELGIEAEVQPLEFQSYIQKITSAPFDYDLYVLGWTATVEPSLAKQIWEEKGIPQLNSGAYINKEVETLFDDGVKEFDREKRKAIYGKIQEILARDLPYVFLYEGQANFGHNKRMGGFVPAKLAITHNIQEWYINK